MLASLLARAARQRPEHPAFSFQGRRWSFRELDRDANRLANALLAQGLAKGDRVATVLPNSAELYLFYWAAAKTGIVSVPMSPLLQGPGLATLLRDSGARAVIATAATGKAVDAVRAELPGGESLIRLRVDGEGDGWLSLGALMAAASDAVPADPGLEPGDIYNIIYSSGTTGLPKGIVHTHRIRADYGPMMAAAFAVRPDSVVLQTGSLVFNGAFIPMIAAAYQGATFHLHPKFDPVALVETVAKERVTHVMLVPAQIAALLAHPVATAEALGSLECVLSLGAPLLLEHKQALIARLPRRLYELYGLTEGFATVLDRDDVARKPGSVGGAMPYTEIRIVDSEGRDLPPGEVGEIVGRSGHVTPGYYNRPDLTAQAIRDGWVFTGDLGYLDEEGFLYLVDRKKDMIVSGGINVYPRDIEEVAIGHPAVREAAAFGIPDDRWGEVPVIAVLTTEPVEADALAAWINERVGARYQRVKQVLVMDDFPRNVAGKTLKRELRAPYWKDRGRSI
ncbi:MAG: class I adenylate-forming enzyme family protein [Gemmatimonadales bacterium]